VPPDPLALNVTAVPTVPVDGPLIVTAGCVDETTIDAVFVARALLTSVALAATVYVPFTLYVTVKLAPVPVVGVPPGALHVNV
jgi:hypothetical protein